MEETETQETQDPQDTAVLSDEMAEPKVEQREVEVESVYAGLVEVARTHGKLYRTNGKRADMVKFDFTAHSAFVGNLFIVHRGHLLNPLLETAAVKVDISGLPWLTEEERKLDPVELFRNHYYSRPNGSEKYMSSNFPAKDIDEMSDDEIAQGEPRGEARVKLEAWILCASLDGTLKRYVESQPTWRPGSWWWSPKPEGQDGTQLVVKTDWWLAEEPMPALVPCGGEWELVAPSAGDGRPGRHVAQLALGTSPSAARAMQVSVQLARAAKALADEAFALQMRAKCFDIDPLVGDVSRLVEYINTGRMRQAWSPADRQGVKNGKQG